MPPWIHRRSVAAGLGAAISALLVASIVALSGDADPVGPPASDPLIAFSAAATTTTTSAPATTTTEPAPATTTTTAPPLTTASAPGDPATVAARIVEAERALADPRSLSAEDLARWSYAHQTAYRAVVARPEWRDAVRAGIPDDVRHAFEHNLAAGANLRAMHKRLRTTLPRWRIIAPRPADELMGYYRAAEAEFGVPWPYLAGINLVETRMGRIIGLSSAGAQGPMQFMPATWAAYGEGDVNDPKDAIRGAARYLAANGAPHDMDNALWNYNHDTRYVEAVKLYAQRMMADPDAYLTYHGWQVVYLTAGGDVLLHEGWVHPEGEIEG